MSEEAGIRARDTPSAGAPRSAAPTDAAPAAAVAAVGRHGRAATAFQLLESGWRYWTDATTGGVVAYVDTGGAWVAGGEPLAAPADVSPVATRFLAAARSAGRRGAFFGTEGALDGLAGTARLRLGAQPVWDPRGWPAILARVKSLRAQLRRAQAKGVRVRRVAPAEVVAGSALRAALDALLARWDAQHAMAQMRFLVTLEPFSRCDERRVYVAERGASVVGFLSLAPVPARAGWLFEDLVRAPDAPNGTSELLVDAAMRDVAADGSGYATLGLAPLAPFAGEVTPWLARVRTLATPFFNFRGLAAFKAKLRPARWDEVCLVHDGRTPTWRALLDALTAFAGGSLLRFGVRTLWRGPQPAIAAMAVLLVPWTLVLSLLDPARWYPAPWVRQAWVGFDLLLCVGLALLAWRWRPRLGALLATAVTLDALLTLGQAIVWYAPRADSPGAWLGLVVACAAPSLAAFVLWGAVRRHALAHGMGGAARDAVSPRALRDDRRG